MIRAVLSFLCYVKVCQRLPEYGVHFHRVLPEKRSLTGIMLGIYSKGVLIFEVLNGNRTPVLRFPWRDTKTISFTVRCLHLRRSGKSKEVLLQAVFTWSVTPLMSLCFCMVEKEDLLAEHFGRDQTSVSDR